MNTTNENQIILEDSNVTRVISDVVVIEERFDEHASTMLTTEQVNIELTGLLYTFYKDQVTKRVSSYLQLMNTSTNNTQVSATSDIVPTIHTKSVYYPTEEDMELLSDTDVVDHVQFEDLSDFFAHVNRLQQSSDIYQDAHKKIQSMFVPFVQDPSTPPFDSNMDVLHEYENGASSVKRVLKGNTVKVKGYINTVHPGEKHHTFDWTAYIQHLQTLKEGDHVTVYLNDFVLPLSIEATSFTGIVTSVTDTYVITTIDGNDLHIYFDKPSCAYVYSSNDMYHFCKHKLVSNNIRFLNIPTLEYIVPCSYSEFLYSYRSLFSLSLPNFETLARVLSQGKYEASLIQSEHSQVFRKLLEDVTLPPLVMSKNKAFSRNDNHTLVPQFLDNINIEGHTNAFYDNDLFRMRFLHADCDFENEVLTRMLSKHFMNIKRGQHFMGRVKSILQKMKASLEDDVAENNVMLQRGSKQEQTKTIAKIYTSTTAINEDTGKHIYFDKQLDPTLYGLKPESQLDGTQDIEESIRRKLLAQKKRYTASEIEFELRSIMQGRRRVRIGDHCILDIPSGKFVYVRRKVGSQGEHTWVKVSGLPSSFCIDTLLQFNELHASEEHVVYDSYSNTCVALEAAVQNAKMTKIQEKLNVVKQALEMITDTGTIQQITRLFDNEIERFQDMQDVIHYRDMVSNVMKLLHMFQPNMKDFVDDGDYFESGDMLHDQDELTMTYQDQYTYATLHQEKDNQSEANLQDIDMSRMEIVHVFATFTGVKLDSHDVVGINALVAPLLVSVHKRHDIFVAIEKRKQELNAGINMKMYTSLPDYKRRVDETISAKVRAYESELVSTMYKDVILAMTAAFALYIMMKHPKKVINDIYPSCVRMFSYSGYPLRSDKNVQKNLTRYLCCMVKNVCVESDPRYAAISKLSIDGIYDEVVAVTDKILQFSPNIKVQLEINKDILEHSGAHVKDKHSAHTQSTFYGFKPNVVDARKPNNKHMVVEFIALLNNAVQNTKKFKVSLMNVPLLQNSCCIEKLHDATSYYSFIKSTEENKATYDKIYTALHTQDVHRSKRVNPLIKHARIQPRDKTCILTFDGDVDFSAMQTKKLHTPELPSYVASIQSLFQSAPFLRQNNPDIFTKMDVDSDDYWDTIVLPEIENNVEFVHQTMMEFGNDIIDHETFVRFKSMLMIGDALDDMKGTIKAFTYYMTVDVPRLLYKIRNHKHNEENDTLTRVAAVFSTQLRDVASEFNSLKPMSTIMVEDDTKHMLFVSYVCSCVFKTLIIGLYGTSDIPSSATMNQKDISRLSLISKLMMYMMTQLMTKVTFYANDIRALKNKEEELREKSKVDKMSLYEVDDELRKEQMDRQKIGMNDWFKVGDKLNDLDILVDHKQDQDQYVQVIAAQKQTDEIHSSAMGHIVGDNSDANEIDEDLPSHRVFERD